MVADLGRPHFTSADGTVYPLEPRYARMVEIIIALAPRMRRVPVGELTLRFNGESVEALLAEWLSARTLSNQTIGPAA